MQAAFFDLDKTVIDRASIMAFARDFRREGLLTRRTMAKGAWRQLVYMHRGADPQRLEAVRRSVLAVTKGWDREQVRSLVGGALTRVIDPITYAEARDLIDRHRAAGRRVYLVSAAPVEIVEPLAEHFGVDEAIASVARVDGEGRYTGELETYVYGPAKAELIRSLAERDGLDLDGSYAYSDSATDLPMLEAVGIPVAVNPDRELRAAAEERGWEIVKFARMYCAGGTVAEPAPATAVPERHRRRALTVWAPLAAAAAAGGGATAVVWHTHRAQLRNA